MVPRPPLGNPRIPQRRGGPDTAPVVRLGGRRDRPAPSVDEPDDEDLEAIARDYARGIKWRLRIPGRHYGGLSNEALLEVRKAEGRDFAADTKALRAHALERLVDEVSGWRKWSEIRADRVWAEAAHEWVVLRVERGGYRDVDLKALAAAYAAWKRKKGLDSRIGIARGNWLRAVKRGHVEVTT